MERVALLPGINLKVTSKAKISGRQDSFKGGETRFLMVVWDIVEKILKRKSFCVVCEAEKFVCKYGAKEKIPKGMREK